MQEREIPEEGATPINAARYELQSAPAAATSAAVIASMLLHTKEISKSAAKSLLKEVVGLKADGPSKVVFELSGGNADFPARCLTIARR
jgi:hypothetical protein